eukprot:scaffold783_cov118-Cylindrotheca_fusiformis.AAC.12
MNEAGKPPAEAETSRPLPMHPPVNVVVVRETPPRTQAYPCQGQQSSLPTTERATPFSSSPVSSAFRLQPRGTFATPSPSARGRKRNSQCLVENTSATPEAYVSAPRILPSGTQVPNHSPASRYVCPSESQIAVKPKWETPIPRADVAMKHCSPSRVESALQSLSIKSPRISRSPDSSFNAAVAGRQGSSFIVYSSSPMGSSYNRFQGESSFSGVSTNKVAASPSSTMSSPKLAPLTVLPNPNEESMTPTHHPPLYGRPSFLLLSLDNTQSARHDDVGRTRGGLLDGQDSSVRKQSHAAHYSSPRRSFDQSSPSRISRHSPGTPSRKSPPRTPLPRLKLTPKSQSRRENCAGEENGLGLLPNDFRFNRSSRPPLFSSGRKTQLDESSSTSLFQPQPMLPVSPPPRKRSYLPIPEWNNDVSMELSAEPISLPSPRKASTDEETSNMTTPSNTDAVGESSIPVVETKSLLTPSRSRSLSIQMMANDSRRASMEDVGSLTDSDDDETFVLTNPSVLVEEQCQARGRARQRQRLSFHSLDKNGASHSSTSLALSTQASNTSLFGMEYMGDSSFSLRSPDTVPASSLNTPTKRTEHALSPKAARTAGFQKEGSENSLLSVGLALEDTEAARDLTTPPAVAAACSSPPPLSVGEDSSAFNPFSSVYVSKADPDAVNMTISRMAFHASQRSPKMKCI